MLEATSPYEFSRPITDPELLALRSADVAVALDAIAPGDERGVGHAVILADQRAGKTSILREVARQASEDRASLVVTLRPTPRQLANQASFVRHLLLATVEAVATHIGPPAPDWYLAWRERVYLRNSAPITHRDALASALVLSADSDAEVDPIILEQDLRTLGDIAATSGAKRILLCLDDAAELTQDTSLVEQLVATLEGAGRFSMLLAGAPTIAQYFMEAVSPCLRSFQPVKLEPLIPWEVMTCLAAPLSVQDRQLINQRDVALARDIVRLTGGSPYEVMVVAHHMWTACQTGEIDRYALTPRVLDRMARHLAEHTSGGDVLLDSVRAIRRLDSDQVPMALEIVAFSRLTVRQIAIAKALGITSRDADRVSRGADPETIERIAEQVRHEIAVLEAAGVIELAGDGESFLVLGGRRASVLLQYEAGGPQNRPFDLDFLRTVGRPLVRDIFTRAAERIEGVRRLSVGLIQSASTTQTRASARRAVADLADDGSLEQIARGGLALVPRTHDEFDRVSELIAEVEPRPIALISATLAHDRSQLEYVELWELPPSVDQHELDQHLAHAIEDVMPSIQIAELRWRGLEAALVDGEAAREAVILLTPFAADIGVARLFGEFLNSYDDDTLAAATLLASTTVRTLEAHPVPPWVKETLLSIMLSKLGFLEAFNDDRLSEAEEHLRRALQPGVADGWVTDWNLANVLVRTGRHREAEESLAKVGEQMGGYSATAVIVFFVPGGTARDSVIRLTPESVEVLLRLQRAMVACASHGSAPEGLRSLLEACVATEEEGALEAVALVERSVGVEAQPRSSTEDK